MKRTSTWIVAMMAIAGLTFAGCGGDDAKKKDDGKKATDTKKTDDSKKK